MRAIFVCFFCFFAFSLSAFINYEVHFTGLSDSATLKELKENSQLITAQKKPLRSINALRYRLASDLPQMIKILHANGYFDAKITTDVEEIGKTAKIEVMIDPGIRYTLNACSLLEAPFEEKKTLTFCENFSLEMIGLKISDPFLFTDIANARMKLLSQLALCGYPLAEIVDQQVIANVAKKTVDIILVVNKGTQATFGPLTMTGLVTIKPAFIYKKILWQEGEVYSTSLIEQTQRKLLSTDLFSSVMITHSGKLIENNKLPIKIDVTEAKHKNINLGANYATYDGFGASLGWSNRNIRGLGESLFLNGEFSKKLLTGAISFKKPDVLQRDQDFIATAKAEREQIYAYLAFTYGGLVRLDRRVNQNIDYSFGAKFEYTDIIHSANDGKYSLLSIPVFFRYTTANNLLNATKGFTFTYLPSFFANVCHGKPPFLKQTFTGEFFVSNRNEKFTVAFRGQLGSIVGASVYSLPMTKLFLGGSEIDLRGYRYKTVSPLNADNKPIGGKSALYMTLETRIRPWPLIGFVPFFDMGVVSKKNLPQIQKKWFKSVGIGLRYFTFFGPLRLDVGFPLNRRSFDSRYRIYVSIGQTF